MRVIAFVGVVGAVFVGLSSSDGFMSRFQAAEAERVSVCHASRVLISGLQRRVVAAEREILAKAHAAAGAQP